MPVKPDKNTKHLQLVLTNGTLFHQSLTVLVKNSDVLIQPTNSKDLHITLHSNVGTDKRKNSHFRIERSSVKHFEITSIQPKEIRNGMLSEWNRKIGPNYDSPLELIFPACFASKLKTEFIPDYQTKIIDYGQGTLYLNFWFTKHDKSELEKYWNISGLKILMFEKLPKNDENFALTYNIIDNDDRFKTIEKVDDFFEISIDHKTDVISESSNKVKFTFGLSPEHKKTIVFY